MSFALEQDSGQEMVKVVVAKVVAAKAMGR